MDLGIFLQGQRECALHVGRRMTECLVTSSVVVTCAVREIFLAFFLLSLCWDCTLELNVDI